MSVFSSLNVNQTLVYSVWLIALKRVALLATTMSAELKQNKMNEENPVISQAIPDLGQALTNLNKAKILIVDDVLLPLYEQFKDKVSFKKVIVVPLTGDIVADGYTDYEDFISTGDSDFDYPAIEENQAAGMCYTSGTTGRPKGIVFSHRSTVLHSMATSMTDCLAISQHDVITPVVPMFHVNSWGLPYASVMVGAKQVFPGPHLDAVSLLDLYETEQVTFSAGVPTVWLAIKEAMEAEPQRWKTTPNMRLSLIHI